MSEGSEKEISRSEKKEAAVSRRNEIYYGKGVQSGC